MTTAQVNRAGIARTFQNIRLFGDLTVAENLMVAMNDSMRYSLVGSILHFPRFAREEHIARERAQSCWRATPSARPIWADKTKKYGKTTIGAGTFRPWQWWFLKLYSCVKTGRERAYSPPFMI